MTKPRSHRRPCAGRAPLHAGLALLAAWPGAGLAAPQAPAHAAACEAASARAPARVGRVALIGSTSLERTASGPARALGGVSGMDYDPDTRTWWLLSDDKGEHAGARAYPARIDIGAAGIARVQVHEPVALPLYAGERPDGEALRRHPCGTAWAWASEGDAGLGQAPSVRWLQWPAPGATGLSALPMGALALPASLQPSAAAGPRPNRSFEGLAFTPSADALWVAAEAPLLQDGALPDLQRGAWLRFTRLPLAGGPASQFAYPVDPIGQAATGGRLRADNGVSEILALAGGELLVVERGGREIAADRFAFSARLYVADATQAGNVAGLQSLAGADIQPMAKRLLLDLATLGLPRLDNIEAAAWGPRLADGRALLLLASDDNFAPGQVTQLIALAIEEAP